MSYINFNNTAQNGFQNALAMGMQMGAQAREAKERKEYKNALAQFDPSNPESVKPIMALRPEVGLQLQGQIQQRQAQQTTQRKEDMGVFRQLLGKAGESPEGWAQAMGAAQQMGLDVSDVPPQYDPQWAQSQLFILDALESEKDNLPGLAEEVLLSLPEQDRDPNSPVFREAYGRALEGKYAVEYTDANGNVRRRSVLQRPVMPSQEAIAALRQGVGTPEQFDAMFGPGAAARAMGQQGGPTQSASGGFPRIGPDFLSGLQSR